jgi:hypothetical protein
MNIVENEIYKFKGSTVNGKPHGRGMFRYKNGDLYIGYCQYGMSDGFGKLTTYDLGDEVKYVGYFSCNKKHGVGTLETPLDISKGHWRFGKKHGTFYRTDKINSSTTSQVWMNNKLISEVETEYLQPDCLKTIKNNPNKMQKKKQVSFKVKPDSKCVACMENPRNSTNVACGHVSMCYDCLSKCKKCPICRVEISKILKLYLS